MRADFTAQVIVPRDMTMAEARRFAHSTLTLAHDCVPPREDRMGDWGIWLLFAVAALGFYAVLDSLKRVHSQLNDCVQRLRYLEGVLKRSIDE
jgi:hypothetical protein